MDNGCLYCSSFDSDFFEKGLLDVGSIGNQLYGLSFYGLDMFDLFSFIEKITEFQSMQENRPGDIDP